MSKPIFIIRLPRDTDQAEVREVYENLEESRKEMFEEYHILVVIGDEWDVEFECFNSPYKEEEFTELKELIKTINDERRES